MTLVTSSASLQRKLHAQRGHAPGSPSVSAPTPAFLPPAVHAQVCQVFNEAQHSASTHRQNVHQLRRLLGRCSGEAALEEQFFVSTVQCLLVVLGLKRTDEIANRLMRFFAGFIVHLAGLVQGQHQADSGIREGGERFLENLMLYSLEHLDVRDKMLRMRFAQILVACMAGLEEMSDTVWCVFRRAMTERLFDKEACVRVQAVHAMSRLQQLALSEADDGSQDASAGLTIKNIFLDLLQHDPAVEVRRAVLAAVDVDADTLHFILSRCRDADASIRRFFYSNKVAEIDLARLTAEQRDTVIKAGLSDRYPHFIQV